MKEKPKPLDLTKVADCREFLSTLMMDCKEVIGCEFSDGRWVNFVDATDEEAIEMANDIFSYYFDGKVGDTIDTHIRTGAN